MIMALAPGTRGYTKAIIAAQMLAQIGAFALPALLPDYIARWNLSKTEAGWLVGIFFAAYVVMVPVLVALTDRVPVRRVYMLGTTLTALSHFGFALFADGFWSALLLRLLAGIGWAGTYMPGLKAIADPLEGTAQSRAVTWHAAGVGISGAASFTIAGLVAGLAGPSAAFLLGGATALSAVLIAAAVMPSVLAVPASKAPSRRLLDFRPVLRNRTAMGWIVGYTVHTWELSALHAWGVTFLAAVCASQGAPSWLPDPTVLFTIAGLAGCCLGHRQRNRAAMGAGARRHRRDEHGRRAVTGDGVERNRAGCPRGGARCGVERGDLFRQLGLDRRHCAGRRQGVARRHHGIAQHVRLCGRLHRAARCRAGARLGRQR